MDVRTLLQRLQIVGSIVLLVGCQAMSGTQAPEPPVPAELPTGMVYRAAPGALSALLRYIPQAWLDSRPTEGLGPGIHLLDVARVRQDLGLRTLSGKDSQTAKASLLLQMDTQGLSMGPLELNRADMYDEWGWDLADVDQSMYSELGDLTVMAGRFPMEEIGQKLAARGYAAQAMDGYTLYAAPTEPVRVALTADGVLMMSSDGAAIASALQTRAAETRGLDSHAAVAALLRELEGAWGGYLAPGADLEAFVRQAMANMASLAPEAQAALNQVFSNPAARVGWDAMLISFRGTRGEPTSLTFVYHYPAAADATEDVGVLRLCLTDVPTMRLPGKQWGDLLVLEAVAAEGSLLKATASTQSRYLIGLALAARDYGFVPVRAGPVTSIPAATTSAPLPTVAAPTATAEPTQSLEPAKPPSSPSPPTSAWVTYDVPAERLSMALPHDWQRIEMDPATLQAVMDVWHDRDPQVAAILEQAKGLIEQGIVFWGIDLSPTALAAGYVANVNVLKSALPVTMSLSVLSQVSAAELENLEAVVSAVTRERVQLPAGEAETLRYQMRVPDVQGETLTVDAFQCLLVDDGMVYTVSLVSKAGGPEDYQAIFEQMLESIRFAVSSGSPGEGLGHLPLFDKSDGLC